MKKLIFILLLAVFIGCEKEDPPVAPEPEELCWECVTSNQVMRKDCTAYYFYGVTRSFKIICGLSEEAIAQHEELGTYSYYVYNIPPNGDCDITPFDRHKVTVVCTLLE